MGERRSWGGEEEKRGREEEKLVGERRRSWRGEDKLVGERRSWGRREEKLGGRRSCRRGEVGGRRGGGEAGEKEEKLGSGEAGGSGVGELGRRTPRRRTRGGAPCEPRAVRAAHQRQMLRPGSGDGAVVSPPAKAVSGPTPDPPESPQGWVGPLPLRAPRKLREAQLAAVGEAGSPACPAALPLPSCFCCC